MTLVPPSSELQALIRKELNEDPSSRDASVQAIKDWLSKEPHLPNTWDDVRILNVLRACNFSLEKCKRKLDAYFTIRAAAPEFFSNWDITKPELQNVIKNSYGPALPLLTQQGRRVVILNGNEKVFLNSLEDPVKVFLMMEDICLGEETLGIAGKVYIVDATIFAASAFAKLTLSLIRKFLFLAQDACPVKIKEIHLVNVHPFMDVLFKLVKPLLKIKLVNRVHFHSDGYESLYKFVPRDILPEEYGGTAGKIADINRHWVQKLEDYIPWFREQENLKADKSKQLGRSIDYDDIFGTEGSFRQLAID